MTRPSESDLRTRILAETQEITMEVGDALDPRTLAQCLDAAQAKFAEARVNDFTPIFFARHARKLIREATTEVAARAPHPG